VEVSAANVLFIMQLVERKQCSAGTEPWLGTSIYALQALHQKLDVANSAAIDLYIDAFLALPSLTAALAIDFFARQKRRFDGREIHFLFVDLGLHLMDELWSDYLAAVADVRGGIHWVSWGGKDPLHTFLMEVTGMFERLDEELREELVAAFAREEFKPEGELPSSFERSATWTYVINDHPWGTMQERWAAKVAQALRVRLGK